MMQRFAEFIDYKSTAAGEEHKADGRLEQSVHLSLLLPHTAHETVVAAAKCVGATDKSFHFIPLLSRLCCQESRD